MAKKRRTYATEAAYLAQAIDIAIDAFQTAPPSEWMPADVEHFIICYMTWQDAVLDPEPQYKNLKSLSYQHKDVFTYFQESGGPTVEYFWTEIKKAGLPFARENKLEKILKKKRISNWTEFNYVIDTLVPFQQEGILSREEAELLVEYIGAFEKKNAQ